MKWRLLRNLQCNWEEHFRSTWDATFSHVPQNCDSEQVMLVKPAHQRYKKLRTLVTVHIIFSLSQLLLLLRLTSPDQWENTSRGRPWDYEGVSETNQSGLGYFCSCLVFPLTFIPILKWHILVMSWSMRAKFCFASGIK